MGRVEGMEVGFAGWSRMPDGEYDPCRSIQRVRAKLFDHSYLQSLVHEVRRREWRRASVTCALLAIPVACASLPGLGINDRKCSMRHSSCMRLISWAEHQ
jgi:hypothetical protein